MRNYAPRDSSKRRPKWQNVMMNPRASADPSSAEKITNAMTGVVKSPTIASAADAAIGRSLTAAKNGTAGMTLTASAAAASTAANSVDAANSAAAATGAESKA